MTYLQLGGYATPDRVRLSGRPDARGPGASLTRLYVERDTLSPLQRVEVQRTVQAGAMKEVFDSVLRCDEPEATVGNELLYGSLRHRQERYHVVKRRAGAIYTACRGHWTGPPSSPESCHDGDTMLYGVTRGR